MESMGPMTAVGNISTDLIAPLRDASRKLVREWGFLGPTLAGCNLSPGAVHCLIEIGDRQACRPADLCRELKISPRQLDRLLSELVTGGNITGDESLGAQGWTILNASEATYRLTATGAKTLNGINAYAQRQVTKALAAAHPDTAANITTAFRLYAAALEQARLAEPVTTPDGSRPPSPEAAPAPQKPIAAIARGYRPALLARTLEMHMDYYYPAVGLGVEFETGLGATLSNLINRLDKIDNEVWTAIQTIPAQGPGLSAIERIVGVIYVDGEIPGRENACRIRAFIVDDAVRGLGLGKKLMAEAMAFIHDRGFAECRLSTMRTLTAARKLYEAAGFVVYYEELKESWGRRLPFMEYEWKKP